MKRLTTGLPLVFALLLTGFLQQGCGGPTYVVQSYDGPVRPRETIAVVRINGDDPIQVVALDSEALGAPIAADARLHIEILPGEHSLRIQSSKSPFAQRDLVAFRAEPGRVYRAHWLENPPQGQSEMSAARVFEVDARTDALVADVSLPSRQASPGAPTVAPIKATPAVDVESENEKLEQESDSEPEQHLENSEDSVSTPNE